MPVILAPVWSQRHEERDAAERQHALVPQLLSDLLGPDIELRFQAPAFGISAADDQSPFELLDLVCQQPNLAEEDVVKNVSAPSPMAPFGWPPGSLAPCAFLLLFLYRSFKAPNAR